jgi:D-xylose transport system permease protein
MEETTEVTKEQRENNKTDKNFISIVKNWASRIRGGSLRNYSLVIITGAIWIVFQFLTGGTFLTQRNLGLLALQTSITGLTAIGAVLLIITRNFDLSIGSVLELISVIIAILTIRQGWGPWPTIALVMVVGLAVGAWQGWWVAKLGVPSFIVTLAGMLYFRGLALTISGGETIAPVPKSLGAIATEWLGAMQSLALMAIGFTILSLYLVWRANHAKKLGLVNSVWPTIFRSLGPILLFAIAGSYVVTFRGIPYLVILLASVATIATILTTNMRFGKQIYAVGSNPEAARLSGIDPSRTIFKVWIFEGFIYGIAGIALTTRVTGAIPGSGVFTELDAIASAIIGGTSLAGGSGTVLGGVLGALLMTSLDNGMSLMNIKTFYQYISKGVVLLVAVYIDLRARRGSG